MKYLIKLLAICGLAFVTCDISYSEADDDAPFTSRVFTTLGADDAHTLYYAIRYLTSESEGKLSDDQAGKVSKMSQFLGRSVPVGGDRPDGMSTQFYMKGKRDSFFEKFSDQETLLTEMTRVAKTLQDPEGRNAAAHIYDLVLDIDPTLVDVAYEREKLFVTDEVKLSWAAAAHDDSAREVEPGSAKDDLMSKTSSGFYEIDFSKLGISQGAKFAGLAKNQSLIKGLLVQELSGSQFAGEASQMNATVVGKSDSGELTVKFNQKVGSMMTDAIDLMMEFLKYRHGTLPEGVEVELSFEEQYIPKDGPSAGVACTLMLDALIKGHEYSPSFAVTGAMDGKGIVGGVGGVDGKIRGAIARNCEMVAIPSENERVIQDMLILEGPATLAKVQIVEIENFEQALKVAKKHETRDPDIQQAVETFREVQKVLNTPNGSRYLRNRKVQTKLRSVLKVLPNHLSAKYLLLKGIGREPGNLTLMGSVQAIDRNAAPLITALREGDFDVQDRLRKDSFGATMSALTRLRPLLDERTRPCADAIVTFSGYIRTAINSPPRSPNAISELSNNVGREYDRLFDRPDVKAELMIDDEEEE